MVRGLNNFDFSKNGAKLTPQIYNLIYKLNDVLTLHALAKLVTGLQGASPHEGPQLLIFGTGSWPFHGSPSGQLLSRATCAFRVPCTRLSRKSVLQHLPQKRFDGHGWTVILMMRAIVRVALLY